jgi:hypothetical protein
MTPQPELFLASKTDSDCTTWRFIHVPGKVIKSAHTALDFCYIRRIPMNVRGRLPRLGEKRLFHRRYVRITRY